MRIEEAILYCLTSQNRRTSESIIKLACILPSEKEEDEVNRRTSESRIKLACILPSEKEEDEVKCLLRLVQTSEIQSLL